jgi:hypothetical protein
VSVNDNATVRPFAALTVADADSPAQRLTVDVRLSHAANGTFTAASLAASGFASLGGGLYRFTGTAARAQAAVRQLVYDPTENQVAPGGVVKNWLRVSVSDGFSTTTATTCVAATSVNDRPTGVPHAYQATAGQALVVSAAEGLLAGASDRDRDRLTAVLVSPPASGKLTLSADGSFTFVAAQGSGGVVTCTYQVSDGRGGLSDVLTLSFDVLDRGRWP